jgi:hypothetical protein
MCPGSGLSVGAGRLSLAGRQPRVLLSEVEVIPFCLYMLLTQPRIGSLSSHMLSLTDLRGLWRHSDRNMADLHAWWRLTDHWHTH